MQRVLVIGSGGSGKSTVAARLGRATGMPVIHLDEHYWRPGWVPTPSEAWGRHVDELITGERWIMDGNYGGTLDRRLARADTVIFLDLPRTLCLARVVGRRLRFGGRSRPSVAPGCPERLTWEFVVWVWTYPSRRRPGILAKLAALGPGTRVLRLRTAGAVERWLREQESSGGG